MTRPTDLERRALDAQLPVTILTKGCIHLVRDQDRTECSLRLYPYIEIGTIRRADFARLCKNCRRCLGEVLERRGAT